MKTQNRNTNESGILKYLLSFQTSSGFSFKKILGNFFISNYILHTISNVIAIKKLYSIFQLYYLHGISPLMGSNQKLNLYDKRIWNCEMFIQIFFDLSQKILRNFLTTFMIIIYSIYGIIFNIYNKDFIYSAFNHQISSLLNQQVVFLW